MRPGEGGLGPHQTAIVPTTEPGVYYILVRGYSEPADDTAVTILADLLPLAITDVQTDIGGDSKYVNDHYPGRAVQSAGDHKADPAGIRRVRTGLLEGH